MQAISELFAFFKLTAAHGRHLCIQYYPLFFYTEEIKVTCQEMKQTASLTHFLVKRKKISQEMLKVRNKAQAVEVSLRSRSDNQETSLLFVET
jgi:hypothetical protein